MARSPPDRSGVLRRIALFLVHSNLFISISATSVAFATMRLSGLTPEFVPLFIVFAATLFVYSFNRLTDIEEDIENVPGRAAFTGRYGKPLLIAGGILYLLAIGAGVLANIPGVPLLVLPVIVAMLYSLFRLKQFLLVKNILVGVSWGIIPLGVGVYYGVVRSPEILVSCVFFTVMLTVAAALFDIKDIAGDRDAGIRTVPIVFGPRVTRIAAAVATGVVGIALGVIVTVSVVPTGFFSLLGFLAYVAAYIPFSTPDRGPLFYGFVIDGEHIFLAALVIMIGI